MPELVRITDVSPRDGLQNEPGVIPTADKAKLVRLLDFTGVDEVEVTSFVSKRWVPQLGDAAELCAMLDGPPRKSQPVFSALVPNEQGFANLLEANRRLGSRGISKAAVFAAASETFSRKNTNGSIADVLDRFGPIGEFARHTGDELRGYVSCAIACPFEGPIDPKAVAHVAERLLTLGVTEIDLGDTIGAATPRSIGELLGVVMPLTSRRAPDPARPSLTLHLHDTFGNAAECVKAALDMGVRSFDGSVAGLGGCPYASTPGKRAPGNIDTRLLVETIHLAGYRTNVSLDKLEVAGDFARKIVTKARASA